MVLVDVNYQPISAEGSMNSQSELPNDIVSVVEPCVADDPSGRSLEDIEELMMEAGILSSNNNNSTASSLNKSMKDEASSNGSERIRPSMSSSIIDASFLIAQSQQSSSEGDSSITSDDSSDEELDVEAQRVLHDQVAPAAPGETQETELVLSSQEYHKTDDGGCSIPVISLKHVELLKYKSRPPMEGLTFPGSERTPAESRSIGLSAETRSVDTLITQDDQQSVVSVQSLISVVAELIAIPVRIMTAVVADLEQEVVGLPPLVTNRPARAEFISVSILKSPLFLDVLGLTLETDTTKDGKKQVLVIQQIDSNGPWRASPLCVGDRIVSINHVPVSHWAPAAVGNYWSTLTDIVTVVAHNPSGDPQKVAVMITKPDPSSRTGLGMRSSRPGRIKISRVNGLFANTLISPGDLILSINHRNVEGQNSSDTANTILQSPTHVTIVARSSHQNAFVISTNQRPNESSTEEANEALLSSNNNAAEGAPSPNPLDRDQDTSIQAMSGLDEVDHCDNCGWTAISILQWVGNVYVALLLTLGVYLCFDQQMGLSFVMGVLVLGLVMANIININIRQVQRQLIERKGERHCETFQMSANVIVIGAVAFLMLLWGYLEYTAVTVQFVVTISLLILAPMLLFINLPSLCVRSGNCEDFEFEDDYDLSAVASIASHRL